MKYRIELLVTSGPRKGQVITHVSNINMTSLIGKMMNADQTSGPIYELKSCALINNPESQTAFYATLSYNQGGPGYIKVNASNEIFAREKLNLYTNCRWAFLYDSVDEIHFMDRKQIAEI